jgi:hypothetical protein
MTTNETSQADSSQAVATIPQTRYFKADNCLRTLAGQTFTPFSNIGSWWGAFKTDDQSIADALSVLCQVPTNAVWEITPEEYAQLTKTTIEIGRREPVPTKLAERISANTAAEATADIIKEEMALKSEARSLIEDVDSAVQVGEVAKPVERRKPGRKPKAIAKDFSSLQIGQDIPKPNFDAP